MDSEFWGRLQLSGFRQYRGGYGLQHVGELYRPAQWDGEGMGDLHRLPALLLVRKRLCLTWYCVLSCHSDTVLNALMFCSSDAGPRCSSPADSEKPNKPSQNEESKSLTGLYHIYICVYMYVYIYIWMCVYVYMYVCVCHVWPNLYKHLSFLLQNLKNIYIIQLHLCNTTIMQYFYLINNFFFPNVISHMNINSLILRCS